MSAWPPRAIDQRRPKVIACGWHRTGTTSLHVALQRLGYRVHGFDHRLMRQLMLSKQREAWVAARHADAFRDFPWNLLYAEFDTRYAQSKFILTERNPEAWLESYKRHHDHWGTVPIHTWIYNGLTTPYGNEAAFLDRFAQHNRDVRNYFRGRGNLLIFDVFSGDGWNKLCGFLGRSTPEGPFPEEKSAVL